MNMLKDISLPILKLALPLILIQICQASLGVINTIVAGRYHYIDLAGIGLGSNMWTPVFILFTGVLYVLVPKISAVQQAHKAEIATLIQQGKKMAFLLSIFGFILIQLLALLCPWLIENPQVASIAKQYLHFVAFGVPGLVYMTLFRFISEGHSLLKPIILTYLILLFCDALL
ncbi:MATE family efflux transporter, partial [Acinetobacter baumannii]